MPSVLITSANRGLGFEFARQYAAESWRVLAACRDPDGSDDLQSLARGSKGHIEVIAMDVTDAASVRKAAARLSKTPVDVLINSAGIYGGRGQSVGEIDYEVWKQVLDVNTLGPMRVVEAFLPSIAASERKLVVTITSGMGSLSDNTSGGSYAYRSSKAAVNMVTRSLAIDLAPRGITCIVVNPGWVQTDMGGPNAKITPQASITAMRRLIDKVGRAETGRFFNHDGREYPW